VALGDLAVFLLMGPALVVMGVWALTGSAGVDAILISLPPALLVAAILHGNNLRDIEGDRRAGVTTVAGLLGPTRAGVLLTVLVLGAYAGTVILVLTGVAPATVMLVLASTPLAVKILNRVSRGVAEAARLVTLPVTCAQLHLLFGLLYVAGLGGDALWR
jgi:1,4-dihydroxy-2-naphthoate polyprenyltransferase